jgi:3-methyladenine DNA glycosylase Tag
VGLDFDVWDFVQPFLVSLVTFGAIVARTSESEMLTNILLVFQTGFFWQTVLAKRGAP